MAIIESAGGVYGSYKPGDYSKYAKTQPTVTPPKVTTPTITTTPAATTTKPSGNAATLALQKQLKAAGFDPGPIDGIMGPLTKAAQEAYSNSLSAPAPTATAPTAQRTNTTPQQSGTAPAAYDPARIDAILAEKAANQAPPITDVASSAAPSTSSAQDYISSLTDALRQSRISALEKAYQDSTTGLDTYKNSRISDLNKLNQNTIANLDTGLTSSMTGLDAEQSGIAPVYYDKRNQAAAASDIGQMNFAQFMASRGIKGNAGAMPEIYRNAGLQNQIGALDKAEASAVGDIMRRRSETQNIYNTNKANAQNLYESDLAGLNSDYDMRRLGLQNAYNSDVSAANADVEAQALKAYIDQMNADRAYALQEAGLTGNYGGTPTLAASTAAADEAYRNKAFDYNVTKDNRDYNYQVSRDNVLDGRWMQQFTDQQKQDMLNRALQSRQISNDEYQAATSRMNAETQQQQVNWNTDPNNPDNQAKPPEVKTTDYKSDPDFAKNISYIDSNPKAALVDIRNNAEQLIASYGYDGYKALLDYATNAQY